MQARWDEPRLQQQAPPHVCPRSFGLGADHHGESTAMGSDCLCRGWLSFERAGFFCTPLSSTPRLGSLATTPPLPSNAWRLMPRLTLWGGGEATGNCCWMGVYESSWLWRVALVVHAALSTPSKSKGGMCENWFPQLAGGETACGSDNFKGVWRRFLFSSLLFPPWPSLVGWKEKD